MKRFTFISIVALIALLLACACAKDKAESSNSASKREFRAWVHTHYPEARETDKGIFVLEDIEGDGEEIRDSVYIYINYEVRSLYDSSILNYNMADMAVQMGTYTKWGDYDPIALYYNESLTQACYVEALTGSDKLPRMTKGGKRTLIIPGYIYASQYYYTTEAEYMAKVSGSNPAIITVEFVNQVDDIYELQYKAIEAYMLSHGMTVSDTTGYKGIYYWRDRSREIARGVEARSGKIPEDTTIYINYIGRLLNGVVFDTNIKDTAIKYGLGTRTDTYSPASIKWASDSTSITMGSSKVIDGFSTTLWRMHAFESGVGIFSSDHAYGDTGSGARIAPYAPLIFEIDIIDNGDE